MWVDVVHGFGDDFGCGVVELEGWVFVFDVVVVWVWVRCRGNCETCFVSNGDKAVVEGVSNVSGVGVSFLFVGDGGG